PLSAPPTKKSPVISQKQPNILPHHQPPHTIIPIVLHQPQILHNLTIVPPGQAGAYPMILPKQHPFLITQPQLLHKICRLLPPPLSHHINFPEVSTGAS
ncbi:M41 family metallopeptidase, partial [Staphylococcus epidermidis]